MILETPQGRRGLYVNWLLKGCSCSSVAVERLMKENNVPLMKLLQLPGGRGAAPELRRVPPPLLRRRPGVPTVPG